MSDKTIESIREELRDALNDPDVYQMADRVRRLSRTLDMALTRSTLGGIGHSVVDAMLDGIFPRRRGQR